MGAEVVTCCALSFSGTDRNPARPKVMDAEFRSSTEGVAIARSVVRWWKWDAYRHYLNCRLRARRNDRRGGEGCDLAPSGEGDETS